MMRASDRAAEESLGLIEVMTRSGQVLQRLHYHGDAITIGRAYDNDLVISDPYVCPHHLTISVADEQPVARDLGSINGLVEAGDRQRQVEVVLDGVRSVRIGHTKIRFRPRDFATPSTWVDHVATPPLQLFEKRRWCLLILLLTLVFLLADSHLSSLELDNWAEIGIGVSGQWGALAIWAALWSFANRVLAHVWNYLTHLSIICVGLVASALLETFLSYAGFAISADHVALRLGFLGMFFYLSVILWAHLQFATLTRNRVLVGAALLVSASVATVSALSSYIDAREFSAQPNTQATVKAPRFQVAESQTPGVFFSQFHESQ